MNFYREEPNLLNDFDGEVKLEKAKDPMTFKQLLKEWIIPYGAEILAVVLIVKFVAFFTFVPTGSMEKTIPEKSLVISTRLYEPEKNVRRGDIIVFESEELGMTLVKRCVGLPGDEVTVERDGTLYINGELCDEPYALPKSGYAGEFKVPAGHYLFFGDNRPGSNDARYWDDPYISEEKLIGKARFLIWPFGSFGTLH